MNRRWLPSPGRMFWEHWTGLARIIVAALSLSTADVPALGQESATVDDRRCLRCHGQEHIATLSPAERRSMVGTLLDAAEGVTPSSTVPLTDTEPATRADLHVTPAALKGSTHEGLGCVQCHEDARTLPHAPVLNRATCATSCHAPESASFSESAHAAAIKRGDANAPSCAGCHGGHQILKVTDRNALVGRTKSIHLCGDCHAKHAPVNGTDASERVASYLESTHARGVLKAGLTMAATCADCHTPHGVKPSRDPTSSVHRSNVPATCGKCHVGVVETYSQSVHGTKLAAGSEKAAVCTDCHTAHEITHSGSPSFMADVINECGRCHDSEDATGERVGTYYKSYASSYHGQVTKLGGKRAARCSDCHGSHDIRSLEDPESRVAQANLVKTCRACHDGANANFVRFDPHANHRDAKNYPVLHGVWLYFMVMMSAVFTFFGVHTILWFFRARVERKGRANHRHPVAETAIRRFTALDRVNHAFVAITFFGLTATGIPLVFADDAWARVLASLLGGIEAAGLWHRFFAVVLIINFAVHFAGLARSFLRRRGTARQWLFGPNSMVPRWKDAKDAGGMMRWFFRGGKLPRLDRWAYWEKFDYWAEVGGSMIIGGSGLLLWFPEIAAKVLPGWIFNVAMIVHGYEALLAIGFIFTIHFFNAHLRPGAFPVDEVIFTGSLPEQELKEQRPEEYERLAATGALEGLRVKAPDKAYRPWIVGVAVVSVGFGLVLLGLILVGGLL